MLRSLLTAALLAAFATAKTSQPCDPLTSSCPSDPALGTTFSTTFNKSMTEMDSNLYNITRGDLVSFGNDGAALALHKTNDSVTIATKFYIMWGQVECIFKAAKGTGIISTIILYSDDGDEIDWEIMGGNDSYVSNNWFGHGNEDQRNSNYPQLTGAHDDFHNYTFDWNKDRIQYIINNNVVREVKAGASGEYPQTPSFIRFGIWAGGDTAENEPGTVDWAGGPTDWSKAPFVMTVKSLRITDGTSNSSSYSYGDNSGSWSSIKTVNGQSSASQYINKLSTSQQAIKNFNGLSTAAKIGIAAGVLGGLAIFMLVFCIYCFMQRKKGREEKKMADREWEAHEKELMDYRRKMQKGGFAVSHMGPVDNRF